MFLNCVHKSKMTFKMERKEYVKSEKTMRCDLDCLY